MAIRPKIFGRKTRRLDWSTSLSTGDRCCTFYTVLQRKGFRVGRLNLYDPPHLFIPLNLRWSQNVDGCTWVSLDSFIDVLRTALRCSRPLESSARTYWFGYSHCNVVLRTETFRKYQMVLHYLDYIDVSRDISDPCPCSWLMNSNMALSRNNWFKIVLGASGLGVATAIAFLVVLVPILGLERASDLVLGKWAVLWVVVPAMCWAPFLLKYMNKWWCKKDR